MEAIGKEAPVPSEDPIERAREPDAQALHAARQTRTSVRLDDEMEMVAQHREFCQPNAMPPSRGFERLPDRAKTDAGAKVRDISTNLERHVHRARPIERRATGVADQRGTSFWFPPCTAPFATVPPIIDFELSRHDSAQ
ncbi:MAG TPA: hypothetical protein VGH20_17110 [Myxococcales bacterium]